MRSGLFFPTILTAMIVGGLPAGATETRVRTLQDVGGMQDEIQVFTYPGRLPLERIALIELGTAAANDVYAAAFVGKNKLSAGIAVSRTDWLFTSPWLGSRLSLFESYQDAVTNAANGTPLLLKPARPVELLGAIQLGKSQSIGIRLAVATKKTDEKTGEGASEREQKTFAEQSDLTLGYFTSAGNGSIDAALNSSLIARQKRSEKAVGVDSSTRVVGKPSMNLSTRWLGDRTASTPYAQFEWWNRSFLAETKTAGDTKSSNFKESAVAVEGGYAHVLTRSDKELARLFSGVSIGSTKSSGPKVTGSGSATVPSYLTRDEKAEVTANLMSLALAGEARIGDGGFGTLMGMRYALYGTITEKDKTTGVETKKTEVIDETADATLWSLGLFYKQQNMRVDASYGRSFLYNGPHFISGNTSSPLFGRLSASYEF